MVDDKTSHIGLLVRNTHPSAAAILDASLAQGFIETTSGSAPTPVSATAAVIETAVTQSASPNIFAPVVGQAPVAVSMLPTSGFACRTLLSYLGPGADDLTALVEKCMTLEELTVRLEKCREVLQGVLEKNRRTFGRESTRACQRRSSHYH